MKRAVARVKRKKAGTGAKRKAPRRRTAAKTAPASVRTRRPAVRRKKGAKVKATKPRRAIAKRKVPAHRSRLKSPRRRLKSDESRTLASSVAVEMVEQVSETASTQATTAWQSVSAKILRTTVKPGTRAKAKAARPPGAVEPRKVSARKPRLKVPALLLEGDEPELPAVSGPGQKFALGPEQPPAHFATEPTHLPATYGTGQLFLTARDPHWLYAHWDIHTTTQFRHNAKSVDRHLILRMHEDDLHNPAVKEIHVHPESRHWFAHVEGAGKQYFADLGYYQAGHQWKSLATSAPMRTPPDAVSTDSTVEFATIPLEIPFETMLALLEEGVEEKLPLAQGIEKLRARRQREFQPPPRMAAWTPEQARALEEILAAGQRQRALRGSQEIARPAGELTSDESSPSSAGQFDVSSFFGGEAISSPHGGGESVGRDFWFNVNAELIIYGATEPDAKVTIGGRPVALQADGTFSLRFALPDGNYELPIVAVSADNTDGRAAELKFSRATELLGDVGTQPHDPGLKTPTPENI